MPPLSSWYVSWLYQDEVNIDLLLFSYCLFWWLVLNNLRKNMLLTTKGPANINVISQFCESGWNKRGYRVQTWSAESREGRRAAQRPRLWTAAPWGAGPSTPLLMLQVQTFRCRYLIQYQLESEVLSSYWLSLLHSTQMRQDQECPSARCYRHHEMPSGTEEAWQRMLVCVNGVFKGRIHRREIYNKSTVEGLES